MDDIVKQAMAKWPHVPHCYGWLELDARGAWRMRDERAQASGAPGDKIRHPALLDFINRNYMHDIDGNWYFQNGPQRVFVNLQATPYIAHTDSAHDFVVQTGALLGDIDRVYLTDTGQLLLQSADKIAMLDDRDLTQCISNFRMNEQPIDDEALMAWIDGPIRMDMIMRHQNKLLPVQIIAQDAVASRFGFVRTPQNLKIISSIR